MTAACLFQEIIVDEAVERVRNEIRKYGFLSATQIIVRFSDKINDIQKVLRLLECGDIRRVDYTNSYVAPYKLKSLFYFNPTKHQKYERRKRKHTKPTST